MKTPNQEKYQKQADLFKTLTHPVRLAILDILRRDEACVCHIEATLGLRQAYLSQQIAVLREAGLIQDRREGWNVFYRVANPDIFEVVDSVRRIVSPDGTDYTNLQAADCPCPKCNQEQTGENTCQQQNVLEKSQ